ncbi:MAG: preQ(1) synthase [Verrucomicrobiota bacterium]
MKESPTEDLTLLGSAQVFPESPSRETLEAFSNRSQHRDYWIRLDCHDFSSLCPVTGQPDYARVHLHYIPDELCIETKSLKFYLASFRNTKGFNEEIINRIADDLLAVCQPRELLVRGEFAARGGISLTVEVTFPK